MDTEKRARRARAIGNSAGSTPSDAVERSHGVTRRGITYGVRTVEPEDDPTVAQTPTGGVGLRFQCFRAIMDNQFAVLQRAWANAVGLAKAITPAPFDRELPSDAARLQFDYDPKVMENYVAT